MPPLVSAFTMADGSVAPGYEMPEGWYVPPPQPEPTPNFFAMPMDASPDDRVVGVDELGREVRQTRFGTRYWQEEPQPRGSVLSALAEQVRSQPVADTASAVVKALAGGIWDGVSAPARAYQGEPITYGDAANTAGMAMLGGMPVRAPQGALRSGLARDLTPGQRQADEIMELLRAGRGAEITDEMMAAADQAYLSRIYDLPLDGASRMARAREAGFDTNRVMYHGTDVEGAEGILREGFRSNAFGSPREDVAMDYAGAGWGEPAVVEFVARPDAGGIDFDLPGSALSEWGDIGFRGAYDEGMSMGFYPYGVRSPDARFDPRISHLRNLLAGGGGLGFGLGVMLPDDASAGQ